jgi:hypothetical protein
MQTRRTTGDNDRFFAAIAKWRRNHALQQCLADGESCAGQVIQAHSIQSAHMMEYLAKAGHVYMFETTSQEPHLLLIGHNKATTFTGFCKAHDLRLFREVDFDNSRPFDPTSVRQAVLLALRAAAREYWVKLNNQKFYRRLVELGNRKDYESLGRMLNLGNADAVELTLTLEVKWKPFLLGTEVSTRRIKRLFYSLYQQVLTGSFHLTRKALFQIPGSPTVAAASVFAPEFDLTGKELNTLRRESDVAEVVLNVLPAESTTWVVFTYHRRHTDCLSPFFSQLAALDLPGLQSVLSKMIVMHCENVVLAPAFVDELLEQERNLLEEMFSATINKAWRYQDVPDISLFGGGKSNLGQSTA